MLDCVVRETRVDQNAVGIAAGLQPAAARRVI
jgi:hypothetical protein